jgi:DegV family protein with EDD domain
MSRMAFITDSTAYIPKELVDKYEIYVAPQISIWGEESYLDGIDIQPAEFYERLSTTKVMPTTSQATVAYFHKIFEPLVAEKRPILAVLVSDLLSGTIQSATQAKEMFPGATIELVNSKSAAMELGFQVLAAVRAAEAGKSFEEVVAIAEGAKKHTGVYFVVDTLEFLHRGGRIGGAQRLIGTALSMKPLLHVSEGRIEPFESVRTKKKAFARLLDVIVEETKDKPNIRLASLHAAAPEDAEYLLDEACKRLDPVETVVSEVSPAVGTHVGPGTVGLAFSTEL